jgi:hypothetical protein
MLCAPLVAALPSVFGKHFYFIGDLLHVNNEWVWVVVVQMANELNKMLDEDPTVRPVYGQPNGFLIEVVVPLYNVVKAVCGYFHLLSSWSLVLLSVGPPGGWKFKPL